MIISIIKINLKKVAKIFGDNTKKYYLSHEKKSNDLNSPMIMVENDNKKIFVGIDFGTSNSGAIVGLCQKDSGSGACHLVNHDINSNNYAKEPTFLLVKKELLDNSTWLLLLNIGDYIETKQVLFGAEAVEFANNNSINDYVSFDNLKMNLYAKNIDDCDGCFNGRIIKYDLKKIISIYIGCIKSKAEDFLPKLEVAKNINDSEIEWTITIPAIWHDLAKKKMDDVCENVFGHKIQQILEPLSACAHVLQTRGVKSKEGESCLIVDMGGGTTDIVGIEIKREITGKTYADVYKERTRYDGEAVAGKDIDNNFWKYFARRVAESVSESEYTNWSDGSKYNRLIEDSFKSLPVKLSMQECWEKLKYKNSFLNDEMVEFTLSPSYIEWLDKNSYGDIVDALKIGTRYNQKYIVKLYAKDIQNEVYDPVKDQIVKIIREKENEIPGGYDKIILTGGLSCNIYIQSKIKSCFGDKVYYSSDSGSSTNFKRGGAVLYGIPHIVNNNLFLKTKSRLYYYLDTSVRVKKLSIDDENLISFFKNKYGFKEDEIKRLLKKEEEYFDHITDDDGVLHVHVFEPICKAEQMYKDFNESYIPINKTQTSLGFQFYSSENLCLLRKYDRNDVKKEKYISIPLNDLRNVWVRVDITTVTRSYFTAYFSYEENGEAIETLKIDNVQNTYGH
ncbi:MAG: hypothetical protein J6U21_17050 [Bacteroidales bacterium]|nr:hypothetical protein [Bacteroidales bacterium]